jgi:membrane protein YqaA with SNARE-associated domain
MLRRLYDWLLGLAAHPRALWALAGIAFAESIVFPLPPDLLLVPMVLAARRRAFLIAGVCTAASAVGGLGGYGVGHYLFEAIGRPLVEFYGSQDTFAKFQGLYDEWGGWIVAAGGFTPIPYKVITVASGAAGFDPVIFTIASFASRGARFFLEATLLWWIGEPIRAFVERRLALVSIGLFLLVIIGVLAIRFAT